MRRFLIIASAAAITLASVPMADAQSRNAAQCPRGQERCTVEGQGRPNAPAPGQSNAGRKDDRAQENRRAPRAGEHARSGQPFHRAANSRFRAPPRGQEYRVVNEHLVLVDSSTLKIVSVLGLLSNLLN